MERLADVSGVAAVVRHCPGRMFRGRLGGAVTIDGRRRNWSAAAVAALVLAGLAALSASAPASAAGDATLERKLVTFLMLTVWADRDVRDCDTDCSFTVSNFETRALIGWTGIRAVNAASLSPEGRRARVNAVEAFRRWWLSAVAYGNGSYRFYVSHSKDAIRQAAAATKRLGRERWFSLLMISSGCPLWQVSLTLAGEPPCE